MTVYARAVALATVLTASAIVGACTRVGSDPNAVVAITFDALPYPAVVGGDSLRDEAGQVLLLRAAALNVDGDTIPDAAVRYVLLDAGGAVSDAGHVVSTDAAVTSLRVVAEAAGLQSRPLTLIVTPRPDSAAREASGDTLRFTLPDDATNASQPITVRLMNLDGETPANVRGWVVRYTLDAAGDNGRAWFVDDANRRSSVDTTGPDGRAARRLRVHADSIRSASDSIVLHATAIANGAPLAGAPIRVVIQLRPR